MFEDLRTAFREALENFNKELKRDQVPETVDRLLGGMKDEITDEKAEIRGVEDQLEKARRELAHEKELAATCRRRERMAREIGDEETAGVAVEHAVKHEGHLTVLEKKVAALGEELAYRRKAVDEMLEKFTEARRKREELSATAGRKSARDSLSEADDLFSELDRMAEKIEGERVRGEAAEELDESASDFKLSLDEDPPTEELDVDSALAELKRRMGRE